MLLLLLEARRIDLDSTLYGFLQYFIIFHIKLAVRKLIC